MSDFVWAYSTSTGRKARVPAHYLDHPVIGKWWRKTPLSQKAAEAKAPASGDTTKKES